MGGGEVARLLSLTASLHPTEEWTLFTSQGEWTSFWVISHQIFLTSEWPSPPTYNLESHQMTGGMGQQRLLVHPCL